MTTHNDLPYVDQGPEILALDHASSPARVDLVLRQAGRPASERWEARMRTTPDAALQLHQQATVSNIVRPQPGIQR